MAVFFANFGESGHITTLSKKVDPDDGFYFIYDFLFHGIGIDVEGFRKKIGKYLRNSAHGNAACRGKKGKSGDNHFGSLSNPCSKKNCMESSCAVCNGNTVFCSAESGERVFSNSWTTSPDAIIQERITARICADSFLPAIDFEIGIDINIL